MDNLVGQTLGQYQIIGLAGRGGMATVYKAYQPSLNRYVAIKVLPEFMAQDEQFVVRFRQEALAAAGLRHPNILVIHDVGQQGNVHYIAMEFLEGQTLAQVIQRSGGLDIHRVVRIIDQVASALDYAHQRGLIHRDIKPANIFIGSDDHVTLMDFGIAKALASVGVTRTGTMVGTPEYMSPEQIEGRPVDRRSDLYALGVVLYQMLTGYVPFGGETPHAIMYAHVNKPPTPPSRLTAFVTPQVEAVVMRALAKNPAERFASAREMAQALAQGAGQPLTSSEQTIISGRTLPGLTPPPPQRKNNVLWPILAGVGALGLIGAIVIALVIGGILKASGGLQTPASVVSSITPTLAPTLTRTPVPTVSPASAKPSPIPTRTPTAPPTATKAPPSSTPSPVPTATPTQALAVAVPPRSGVLFDFEAMEAWRRGDQPNGTLARSTQQAHSGQSSARLDYDFSTGSNDFVVFLNQVPLAGQPNSASAWVYGNGSGHFLNVWIQDSGGQVWQVPLGRIGSVGWKQMFGTIAAGQAWPWAHVSGPDNGKVDYPISFYGLVLDDNPDGYTGRGTIYVDDIAFGQTAIAATSGPTPAARATTPVPAPTVANEPRAVTPYNPINGAKLKDIFVTFKWAGGALQPGETFMVEIIPELAEKKGTCMTESDYGNAGHVFSPPLTDHQWTTNITAPPQGKSKPCMGQIEWRVHVKDAAGNVIQSTPRSYFEWNPL